MEGKRLTIRDVAREAGVSIGTVSAVLNGRSSVREETRSHVQRVIASLGYRPSVEARRLGSSRKDDSAARETGVGIIVKEVDNPFYAEVVIGAEQALRENGFETFVCTSGGDFTREGDMIDSIRDRGMAGVIIAPVLHEQVDLSHLFQLKNSGYPFTLLEAVSGLPANSVSVNNVLASEQAVRHLLDLGHERIVHFSGPAYTQHTRDRIAGVERAFSQSHVRVSGDTIVEAGARFQDGYRAASAYLDKTVSVPSGVTCFNDLVAMGVLRALAERGMRVPEDVSVVGFDDIPMAEFFPVPLTTIGVDQREMGRQAAMNLMSQFESRHVYKPLILETRLIQRRSTREVVFQD